MHWAGILRGLMVGVIAAVPWQTAMAATAPELSVAIALNKPVYQFNTPGDPIQVTLALKNISGREVLISRGFTDEPFHLLLTFVSPQGTAIIATDVGQTGGEGPPPHTLLVDGQLVQVDPVDILPPTFLLTVTIPDARAFYAVSAPGEYTVSASIPLRTYLAIFKSVEGIPYAQLEATSFQGAMTSNTVAFIVETDADGDSVPAHRDCDDQNANIRPGTSEILNNGLDDDCNPATVDDTLAPVTTITATPTANASGWHQGPVSITLSAQDVGSGVKAVHYSVGGAVTGGDAIPGDTTTLTIAPEGATTLSMFAEDLAGNQESPQIRTVQIDAVAPTGTVVINAGAAVTASPTVNVTLTCTDTRSGCDKMRVAVDGTADTEPLEAVAATKTVTLPSGDGIKTVAVRWTDVAGHLSAQATDTIVLDTTPPTLSQPPNLTVNATSASGAGVSYAVPSATDPTAPVTVTCAPPSGFTFPIGSTTVLCTAKDGVNNSSSKSFTVTVKSASTQITDLKIKVNGLTGVSASLKNSLTSKLDAAQQLLTQGNLSGACGKLKDFIQQVQGQSGKGLTAAQITALLVDANRIKAVIGCP
jgi:hypothetical protein